MAMTSPQASALGRWLGPALAAEPPRSGSLIVTVFGDSLAVNTLGIWLQDLIRLLSPFDVNERLVRTSVFRLAEEGWLQARREGRRSHYSLTPSGARRFAHASRRIYAAPPAGWDGQWTVVACPRMVEAAAARAELRRELEWEGFGVLASGQFLHPLADLAALDEILRAYQLAEETLVIRGSEPGGVREAAARRLIGECWDLGAIAQAHAGFLARFRPALAALARGAGAQECFVLQTLLIHAWRRVTLHDPRLPVELLPAGWPGLEAYAVCRDIYLRTYEAATAYVREAVADSDVALPAPRGELSARFGGLLAAAA